MADVLTLSKTSDCSTLAGSESEARSPRLGRGISAGCSRWRRWSPLSETRLMSSFITPECEASDLSHNDRCTWHATLCTDYSHVLQPFHRARADTTRWDVSRPSPDDVLFHPVSYCVPSSGDSTSGDIGRVRPASKRLNVLPNLM